MAWVRNERPVLRSHDSTVLTPLFLLFSADSRIFLRGLDLCMRWAEEVDMMS